MNTEVNKAPHSAKQNETPYPQGSELLSFQVAVADILARHELDAERPLSRGEYKAWKAPKTVLPEFAELEDAPTELVNPPIEPQEPNSEPEKKIILEAIKVDPVLPIRPTDREIWKSRIQFENAIKLGVYVDAVSILEESRHFIFLLDNKWDLIDLLDTIEYLKAKARVGSYDFKRLIVLKEGVQKAVDQLNTKKLGR